MKLKRREWMLLFAVVGILAVVWVSIKVREGFTGNPIPTQADINSINATPGSSGTFTGTPSSTLVSVFNWVKSNVPFPSGTSDNQIYSSINLYVGLMYGFMFGTNDMTPFINFVSSLPSGGSVTDNVTKIVNFIQSTYPGNNLAVKDMIAQVNAGQPSPPTQIYEINGIYWAYVYLFGKPGFASNTSPSPASSPSTQPATVGIPSPCHNSYKSIPGGSMEFKCFN